jgi:hypothetical protein
VGLGEPGPQGSGSPAWGRTCPPPSPWLR